MDLVLKLSIGEQIYPVKVPAELLSEPADFFAKLDQDMDRGWQMGRFWVDNPDLTQRCQIVADRILTAVYQEQHQLVGLASAYILQRMPGVKKIDINTSGEMIETTFNFE